MNRKLLQAIPIVLAMVIMLILATPTVLSLIMGGMIVFAGQALRVWASGHLVRNEEVTTSGPYAYLRDPLYLGRLLLLVGFCVAAWGYNWIILILGLGVFFFNYMPRKYRKEMARLEKIFGEDYRDYASSVRGLLPRATVSRGEFPEMELVENDAIRCCQKPEVGNPRNNHEQTEQQKPLPRRCIVGCGGRC